MKRFLFAIIFFSVLTSNAATVDTISVYSKSMEKNVKNIIVLPETYSENENSFNVLYLLHGAYGSFSNWYNKVPKIADLADQYNLIIVCPDGDEFGWYVNSPIDQKYQYETYCSSELINYVDKNYRAKPYRSGRVITGLSMGGHGALSLAIKHQDKWSAAGSMSGALNIVNIKNDYELDKRLGNYSEHPERWKQNSVFYLIDSLTNNDLKIIIDCGVDDILYGTNVAVHEKLLNNKIDHTFIVRPGKHDWNYWANAIEYQILFLYNHLKDIEKSGIN